MTGAALRLTMMAVVALALPAQAHEGHDHGAEASPADVRLAPRFAVRNDEVEIVGVLADRNLVIYLDRADDNAPIQDAQIEVEGQGIKGIAAVTADGAYVLPAAALGQPGKHPLTLTIQAGEIIDLLSASLEVPEPVVATADGAGVQRWWLLAGIPIVLFTCGLIGHRLRRQPKEAI